MFASTTLVSSQKDQDLNKTLDEQQNSLHQSEETKKVKELVKQMLNIWPDRQRIKNNLKIASADNDDLVEDPSLLTGESMMACNTLPDQIRPLLKDGSLLESILNECILEREKLIAAKEVTDFDRLDDAFNALIQQGIFCVHNIPATPSSCWSIVEEKLNEYKEIKKVSPDTVPFNPGSIWAVAFYHFQDTMRAERTGQLTVSYIGIADGEQERIDLVKAKFLIMATLKSFGLKVIDPSLDSGKKVFLDINWLLPLKRVSEMEKHRGIAIEIPKNAMASISLEEYKKIVENDLDVLEEEKENAYFINKLLDLYDDQGIEINAKRTFVLQSLEEELGLFEVFIASMPDEAKVFLESVIKMSQSPFFHMLGIDIPEDTKKMARILNEHQKIKNAIPIIESIFNSIKTDLHDSSDLTINNPEGSHAGASMTIAFNQYQDDNDNNEGQPPLKRMRMTQGN